MLLRAVRWQSRGRTGHGDVRVARARIVDRAAHLRPRRGETVVDLGGHWLLPGLINAHDHLGLDLLPRLGTPPYVSFYDWAEEIYRPHETPIVEHQRVPLPDRLAWGGWRNVFGAATTVAHHDPWHARTFRSRAFPVGVVRCAWGHSLGFEDDLRACYRPDRPFVVHAAEGVDDRARAEVGELDRLGVLAANTFLVHAMALSDADVRLLARRNTKVVWCPVSNLHLYGQTAPVAALLRAGVTVTLGTDSTLSGGQTLLHELRRAAETGEATEDELLAMVTHRGARAFSLVDGRGGLEPGGRADLVVIPNRGSAAASLLAAQTRDLLLVLVGGRPRLAHPDIAAGLGLSPAGILIDGAEHWIDERFGPLRARLEATLGPDYPHADLWYHAREPASRPESPGNRPLR